MKWGLSLSLILIGATTLAFGLYLRDGGAPDLAKASMTEMSEPAIIRPDETRVEVATASSRMSVPGNEPEQAASFEEMAREVFDRSIMKTVQDFRFDLQALVREAELLPAQDYETRARDLLARVDTLAAGGYVTEPEALALRLSLLKYALPPNDFRAAADTLISEARQRAEQAESEWASRSDPRLEHYRAEERRIVEHSATMEEFPNGMTRQAYLREKLRQLRSEIYSE